MKNETVQHTHTLTHKRKTDQKRKENSVKRRRLNGIEHSKFNQNGKLPIIYGNFANPLAYTHKHVQHQIIVITDWFDYKLNNKIWKINKFFLWLLIARLLFGAPIEWWWWRKRKQENTRYQVCSLKLFVVELICAAAAAFNHAAVSNSCP